MSAYILAKRSSPGRQDLRPLVSTKAISWFADRTIAAKIVVCFGALIVIGLCVGAVTFMSLSRIETSERHATHSYRTLAASKAIRIGVLTQESSVRGYLLARDPGFLERAHGLDETVDSSLGLLATLASDGPDQQARIAKLKRLVGVWHAQVYRIDADGQGKTSSFGAEGALNRVLQSLDEIDAQEDRRLGLRAQTEAKAVASAYQVNKLGPIVAVIVAACLGWALHREIARPIGRLTRAMLSLADGDTSISTPMTDWRDEIGAMSRALEVFRKDMLDARRLRQETRDHELRAKREREALTASMADRFEDVVGGIVEAVSSSAVQMQNSAESLLGLAKWTTGEVGTVARETKQASATMHSVAAETQHLSDAVGDINSRMARSADVAQQAVAEADKTTATIERLSQSARQIGDIVELINDIARQTNLLALNATIEAARAGDAGRGFAVVALEVKALANETARATADIRRRIEDMQSLTDGSVAAIDQISRRIGEMAETTVEIAGSVSIQGDAARDMMRGTQATARLTAQVSSQLDAVNKGAVTTGAAATDLLSSAKMLAEHSATLQEEARRFVTSVRAG